MAERANILEFPEPRHSARHSASGLGSFGDTQESVPARLLPGSHAGRQAQKKPFSVGPGQSWDYARAFGLSKHFLGLVAPNSLKLLHSSMIGMAAVDLLLIRFVFWISTVAHVTAFATSAFILYSFMFLMFAVSGGLYRAGQSTVRDECAGVTKAIGWTTVGCSVAQHSLTPVALVGGMGIAVLIVARCWWNSVGGNASRNQRNVLIVGDSKLGQIVADTVRLDLRAPYCVRGFLPEQQIRSGYGLLMLKRIARKECIDQVIVASRDKEVTDAVIRMARQNHLDVAVVPVFEGTKQFEIERIGDLSLLGIHSEAVPEWQLAGKRVADFSLAAIGLLVLSPLLLLLAAVVKLDSAGPALYRSVRIGQRGRRFVCFKFRTMIPRADAEKENLRSKNEREGAFFKILHDPRITQVGGFLRRYSLDELPQLWNVMLGDMSLVGPRPHPPDDVEGYTIEHLQRLDCVPGITGLWQVAARRDPSFERCVALDTEYIKSWSLWLDFRILCRTVAAVLQGSGA
jgi:exopolysaccharide biosynthesis polyprenyl glycosylphosphotransferase